jgi:DNA-binding NarL/FixJ family response regulator
VIVDDHRLFVDALALLLSHDDRLDVIGTASDGLTASSSRSTAQPGRRDRRTDAEVDRIETPKRLRSRSPTTRHPLVTGLGDPQM